MHRGSLFPLIVESSDEKPAFGPDPISPSASFSSASFLSLEDKRSFDLSSAMLAPRARAARLARGGPAPALDVMYIRGPATPRGVPHTGTLVVRSQASWWVDLIWGCGFRASDGTGAVRGPFKQQPFEGMVGMVTPLMNISCVHPTRGQTVDRESGEGGHDTRMRPLGRPCFLEKKIK